VTGGLRVTVTGGAGFIGSNLVSWLLRHPAIGRVTVVDDCSTGSVSLLGGDLPEVNFRYGSVLDAALLDRAVARAEAVVHLAALPSVPRSVLDPMASHQANATGTLQVMEAARRAGGPLVNASHSRSYFTRWHRTRAASGGLEITKASHHLDLLSWWLGAQPVAVTGLLERHHYVPGQDGIPADADIHDSVHALIQYDSGATAHYALTLNTPTEGYTCTLRGTGGVCTVQYDARSGPHLLHLRSVSTAEETLHTLRRDEGSHAGAGHRMLTALPGALLPGAPSPFATAAEAAVAVATGAAIHDSSRLGRRLPVPTLSGGSR
jgi:hypothetical protein